MDISAKTAEELRAIKREITATPEIAKRFAEEASKACPDWFRAVYPRLYTDTFGSPRQTAGMLTVAMMHMNRTAPDELPVAYRVLQPILWHMIPKRMPWLFVAPALAEAVQRTTFPDEIDWKELRLPYECSGLILPKGVLTHPTDGDCTALFWGRLQKGEVPVPACLPQGHFRRFEMGNEAFLIVGLCQQSGTWYESSLTAEKRPVVKLNNLYYVTDGVMPPLEMDPLTALIDQNLNEAADRQFIEQMGVMVFGTFLALNARPDLLERERLDHTVKDRKSGGIREFWSPNVIGRSYRAPDHRTVMGGTHASPRLHWRRGHFRQQAYGVGRAERKTIWLEPQLIGADS